MSNPIDPTIKRSSAVNVLLQIVSGLIAVIAVVLAYSDQIRVIAAIDPTFAHWWPIVALMGTILSRVAAIIGDLLDDGKLNNSFGNTSRAVIAGLYLVALLGIAALMVSCGVKDHRAINEVTSYADHN